MAKLICVLEDDNGIREILELLFTEENYEVIGFSNVNEFMAHHEKLHPDLFLLDVMLPDGSGLEVCKIIKTAQLTKSIPVLMMSAHASLGEVKNNCLAEDFIAKPFDIFDLLKRVNTRINVA